MIQLIGPVSALNIIFSSLHLEGIYIYLGGKCEKYLEATN